MPVNIHGKMYSTVAERVTAIHRDNPDGGVSIVTQTVDHVVSEYVIMRTTITTATDGPFTGSAMEIKKDLPPKMQSSYYEVCETSSEGRALFAAGYGGDGDFEKASAEEMQSAGAAVDGVDHYEELYEQIKSLLAFKQVPDKIRETLETGMDTGALPEDRLRKAVKVLEDLPDVVSEDQIK